MTLRGVDGLERLGATLGEMREAAPSDGGAASLPSQRTNTRPYTKLPPLRAASPAVVLDAFTVRGTEVRK